MTDIQVTYSTDILCVWAYVSQVRIDEIHCNFAERVRVEHSYFPVFGNALEKIDTQWQEKGGRAAYGRHVQGIVERFGHLPLADDLWLRDAPTSSVPAHLHLCAAQLLEARDELPAGASAALSWALRCAFFGGRVDISRRANIAAVIEAQNLPVGLFDECIDSGSAFARLSEQTRHAFDNGIKVSPTLIFNQDRQRLSGNVGYRIIEANLRELIESPDPRQSWC